MKAVTWQGPRDVAVEEVPDPRIELPSDAIVRVTATAICGSDLHLQGPLAPFMTPGDVLGHEAMGVVEEIGDGVEHLDVGDRVVVPFNVACGSCWMCRHDLQSQCETTQNRRYGTGASLFGYSELYGRVPGGQAELLRVPYADAGPVKVPDGVSDEQVLFLSDILPTAWQAVRYADVGPGTRVAVLGLGPVGQFCVRIARHLGAAVVHGVDLVDERLDLAQKHGAEVIDLREVPDVADALREATDGRGPDAVIDAVGLEAHGSPIAEAAHRATEWVPDTLGKPLLQHAGIDRTAALRTAISAVRRGGTLSLSGVYGGAVTPLPLMELFDKQITVRQGQCNVRRWTDELLPIAIDADDPLGTTDLVTHRGPLDHAPELYGFFREKQHGCIKVVLEP